MKDVMKTLGVLMAVFLMIIAVNWVAMGNQFFLTKYFAPKQEQVRRETFEQSKAYTQGMIQDLTNMQFEYIKATPSQQKALASIILHRAADFKTADMPQELAEFIIELRGAQR